MLGEATSAIEWEAAQFIAVFNATVDFEKKKLIIGNDALVMDRSEGCMLSFPESFEDVLMSMRRCTVVMSMCQCAQKQLFTVSEV